jgi:hypothetical protein
MSGSVGLQDERGKAVIPDDVGIEFRLIPELL